MDGSNPNIRLRAGPSYGAPYTGAPQRYGGASAVAAATDGASADIGRVVNAEDIVLAIEDAEIGRAHV